ncbi:MAG: hypothetical protein ABSG81_03725 [Acidimicrobiales bacterium]
MPSGSPGLAGEARRQARHILSNPPFTTSNRPSALSHFFSDLGQWLYDAVGPVWRFLLHFLLRPARSGLSAAFGSWWPVVLGAVVVAVGVVVGTSLARRRARLGIGGMGRVAPVGDENPDALERDADTAEGAGDFELAVRLRFRAGLARLEQRGLISGRRTHTSAQLVGMVRSATFTDLASQLDAIVYAGLPAGRVHVGAARAGWPLVPDEARRAAAMTPGTASFGVGAPLTAVSADAPPRHGAEASSP